MLPALLLVPWTLSAPALLSSALVPMAHAGDPCPIDLVFHEATPAWRDRQADLAALQRQQPWVGVSYRGTAPIRVTRVFPGSPAALAGLQEGDHLLAVDGTAVADRAAVGAAIDAAGPSFRLRIARQGAEQELTVTKGLADPVVLGAVQALEGQECRAPSLDALTADQAQAVAAGAFTTERAFRCDDAHVALADAFDSGDVVVVRGGRRVLLAMPGWQTRCIDVAAYDGDALSPESLRALVEDLAAPYVHDRHENP